MKLSRKHNTYLYLSLGSSALFFLVLLFYGSTLPFVGYNAWNFNIYALIAHNYTAFGFFETHLAPIISVAKTLPGHPIYYLNHPPFLSILIAFVFRIVGESFFTARLISIFATFFSALLLFGIGYELKGIRYATIVFVTATLVPAFVVFGRMIGQESLVMFFALLAVYSFLYFERTKKQKWLTLVFLALILGAFTDWAIVYFSLSFAVYLFISHARRLGVLVFIVSILCALLYVLYIIATTGSLAFLIGGFLNRSIGGLNHTSFWIVTWIATILSRLLIYFNPLLMMLSAFFVTHYRKFADKRTSSLLFCLFLFGAIHIVLYPEGSLGHPYWTYYLLPFIILSSSTVIGFLLKKRQVVVGLILLFSLFYGCGLIYWKTKEVSGNVFRYQLASIASSYFLPYQTIAVSRQGLIDPDIFQYSFKHQTRILESSEDPLKIRADGFVFSCFSACNANDYQIRSLKGKYEGKRLIGEGVEMWIFTKHVGKRPIKTEQIGVKVPQSSGSIFSRAYRDFLTNLKAPQL